MAQRIKGITVEIGGDTVGLQKALQDVNKKTRDVQKELRDVDRLLKFDPGNTELIAQRQKLLGEAVETTSTKLQRLKDAEAQVQAQFERGDIKEEQYRAFQREIAETENKLKHFENRLETSQSKVQKFSESMGKAGDKMQNAGKKMTNAGTSMTANVTAPIVAGGAAVFKASMDYETAFANFSKVTKATDKELQGFKESFRELAKEIPVSVEEIANTAAAASQLGISKENVEQFTESMLAMGVATDMTSEEAAFAFARFANVTGMAQEDFDRLGSSVVALGNNFAATEGEITEMAMRVAGAGAQIGMSEADIMGFSTALTSVGINAEAGGTAISKLMIEMASDVDQGGERLAEFARISGMSVDEFKKAFEEDAAGAIITFLGGLGDLSEQGESAFQIIDDLGLSEIRLRDTLLRSSSASELAANAVKTANEAWAENTALTDEANERYNTSEARLKMMWNRIKDVAIELGDVLVPIVMQFLESLQPMIDFLGKAAEKFSELDDSTKNIIVAFLAVLAAIGPLLIIFGQLSTGIGAIIKMVGFLTPILAGIAAPVWITIGVIAALIAIGVLLYKNWDKIMEWAGKLGETIKKKFNEMKENVGMKVTETREKIAEQWEKVMTFFKNIDLRQIGKDIIQGLINGIGSMARDLYRKAEELASGVAGKISGFFKMGSPSKLMMEQGEFVGEGLMIGLKNSMSKVNDMSEQLASAAKPNMDTQTTIQNTSPAPSNKSLTVNLYSPKALDVREANREFNRQLNKLALMW